MRYIIPSFAVILVAFIFPNNRLALVAYIAIGLYSLFLTKSLFRRRHPRSDAKSSSLRFLPYSVPLALARFFTFAEPILDGSSCSPKTSNTNDRDLQ